MIELGHSDNHTTTNATLYDISYMHDHIIYSSTSIERHHPGNPVYSVTSLAGGDAEIVEWYTSTKLRIFLRSQGK